MAKITNQELIELTRELLDSITAGDWDTYQRLCDPTLSAFEPEAHGQLVHGMDFHQFYFDLARSESPSHTSVLTPHVRRLGDDVAVVSFVRLIQHLDARGQAQTSCFQETRVWQQQGGTWRHVHFHRSSD